jgi:hypothetical protein
MESSSVSVSPNGDADFVVDASYRSDDRKNKWYYRSIAVRGPLPKGAGPYAVNDAVRPLLPEGLRSVKADVWDFVRSSAEPTMGIWSWKVRAEKPSQIMAEEDAKQLAHDTLVPALRLAIIQVGEAAAERLRRERVLKQATRLASAAGKAVRQRAKEATRYEQRLAALHAELKAETEVQVRKVRDTGEIAESAAAWDEDFDAEAVEAATRLFDRFATPSRGLLPRYETELTITDVFGEEG